MEGEREGKRTLLEVDLPFGLDIVAFRSLDFGRTVFVDTRVGEDAVQLHQPVGRLDRLLGKNGVYILRKFFGVVLLAISVKFITKNLIEVIAMVQHGVAALGQ